MIGRLESPATVAAGCALIIAVNLVVLGGAAFNRRGEPDCVLTVTERELAMPLARQPEDSGIALTLRLTQQTPELYRLTASYRRYQLPPVELPWLDREKLQELGVSVDLDPSDPDAEYWYRHAMTRRVYVVAEYDGPAWRAWLARREMEVEALPSGSVSDAEALLALDREMRSRLFPVDAGRDPVALRRRYPDRGRYVVLEGLLQPRVVRSADGPPALSADIYALTIGQVHVSRDLGRRLEPFLPAEEPSKLLPRLGKEARSGWPSPRAPRYRAVLTFGRLHEPWLSDVVVPEGGGSPGPSP